MKNYLDNLWNRLRNSRQPASSIEIERAERIFYLQNLRNGMTVFDVGANIGELTLIFSRFAGDDGKIHAFEASAEVFKKLETVCRIAGCRNVALNHLALANENGILKLNVYEENFSGFNSLATRPLKNYGLDLQSVGTEEVLTTTVDDYCTKNKISFIDLLKIDVEGAELQVLRGARRMLETKSVALLTFEFGQTTFDMGNDPTEIESYLNSLSYKIHNLMADDPVFPGRESVETARYSMHIAKPV